MPCGTQLHNHHVSCRMKGCQICAKVGSRTFYRDQNQNESYLQRPIAYLSLKNYTLSLFINKIHYFTKNIRVCFRLLFRYMLKEPLLIYLKKPH